MQGFALRIAGRYDEAINAFREYADREPAFGHIDLAIIYVETDEIDAARREADEVLRHRPGFTIATWADTQMYKDGERLRKDLDALRVAGLPES